MRGIFCLGCLLIWSGCVWNERMDPEDVAMGGDDAGTQVDAGVYEEPGAPAEPLGAPTGLTVTPGDRSVQLTWQPPGGLTGTVLYEVYAGTTAERLATSSAIGSTYGTGHTVTGLTVGQTYYFAVRTRRGSERSPLSAPVSAIPDAPPLTVVRTSPASDTREVGRMSDLSVSFSAGVSPSSVVVTSTPPQAFRASRGYGGSQEIILTPSTLLAGGTTYSLEIQARNAYDRPMGKPHVLVFTTGWSPRTLEETAPTVSSVQPASGSTGVMENEALSVRFSKPMDPASVEAAWRLQPPASCTFTWSGNTVTCVPGSPLQTDTDYVLTIAASARSGDAGQLPLESDFTSPFHTARPPSVTGFTPSMGAQGQPRHVEVQVQFSRPMDCERVTSAFHFVSPSRELSVFSHCSGSSATFEPDTDFSPGDQVSWRLEATATDTLGHPLPAPVTGTFRIVRVASKTLNALATHDGFIGDQGSLSTTGAVITTGTRANNEVLRGLLSFDLNALPPEAVGVSSATLTVVQTGVRGSPFSRLGTLTAYSVPFGPVASPAFAMAEDERLDCVLIFCRWVPDSYVLSKNSFPGPIVVDVSWKVARDFTRRVERGNLSQFRTQFDPPEGGATPSDGTEQSVDLVSAEGSFGKPSLSVQYEYP